VMKLWRYREAASRPAASSEYDASIGDMKNA
jgi:hypothetical protein